MLSALVLTAVDARHHLVAAILAESIKLLHAHSLQSAAGLSHLARTSEVLSRWSLPGRRALPVKGRIMQAYHVIMLRSSDIQALGHGPPTAQSAGHLGG
jgi:hypothetical protein